MLKSPLKNGLFFFPLGILVTIVIDRFRTNITLHRTQFQIGVNCNSIQKFVIQQLTLDGIKSDNLDEILKGV